MGNSKVKYDFFDISKAKISYRLRCANYIGYNSENIFDYRLKIGESLNFLSSFYKKESLSNVALRHFNLKRELLQVYPNQALKEDLFLLSLTPLFLKDSRVWCVFIKDENLSHENIKALEGLFLSKIENTKAIILYSTESGKSLNFEFENELMLFKKD
jgi:ABC-type transport system involved in cytochrome c biogenesis ATPase subunit